MWMPPSTAPLTEAECDGALPERMAVDCGVEQKAILKVAVASGVARGVTITLTKDRPSARECQRKRVLATKFRSTSGLSRCIRTFEVPEGELALVPMPDPLGHGNELMPIPDFKPPSPSTRSFNGAEAMSVLSGSGVVNLSFAPAGNSEKVEVIGGYDVSTRNCIWARFQAAKVQPFDGASKPMTWPIKLE